MAQIESIQQRKRALVLSLDATRATMRGSTRDLRQRINPLRRITTFFRENPLQIFGGTAAAVALLTLLRPRRRDKSPKSMKVLCLGWALGIAKPIVKLWLTDRVRTYIQTQHTNDPSEPLLGP